MYLGSFPVTSWQAGFTPGACQPPRAQQLEPGLPEAGAAVGGSRKLALGVMALEGCCELAMEGQLGREWGFLISISAVLDFWLSWVTGQGSCQCGGGAWMARTAGGGRGTSAGGSLGSGLISFGLRSLELVLHFPELSFAVGKRVDIQGLRLPQLLTGGHLGQASVGLSVLSFSPLRSPVGQQACPSHRPRKEK